MSYTGISKREKYNITNRKRFDGKYRNYVYLKRQYVTKLI